MNLETDKWKDRLAVIQTDGRTVRWMDRQADRWPDRRMNGHRDRWIQTTYR